MPTLLFEYSGRRHAGTLIGRVLIGRRLASGIVVNDPAVSRLHAWIEHRNGEFVLTDAGSRTGTFVNGDAVVRWELKDGDRIQIGPATMIFRSGSELPEGVETLHIPDDGGIIQSSTSGILFNCTCGAPLWVSADLAGHKGLCKYCGEPVRVPRLTAPARPRFVPPTPAAVPAPKTTSSRKARPSTPRPVPRHVCGVCQTTIAETEITTTCPSCGLTFHTDCWQENYGCSSYGCPQVNALKPPELESDSDTPVADEAKPRAPVELLLLTASLVASLVGALLFGGPALFVALLAMVTLIRGKELRRSTVLLAMLIALAGMAAGLVLSDFWWFDGQHLPQLW